MKHAERFGLEFLTLSRHQVVSWTGCRLKRGHGLKKPRLWQKIRSTSGKNEQSLVLMIGLSDSLHSQLEMLCIAAELFQILRTFDLSDDMLHDSRAAWYLFQLVTGKATKQREGWKKWEE